ncbi:MvdC/MvdD family ATP grasp protein [Hyalangium rubrum]|uniref:ATP-grasp domain-containing protein n=1 Tax=Hyalangium rubrum TaxID=3103134 RepID=A0ABU5HAX8_9BACT|nr:hypothetical protein [Hyalangium sp. s54d21]MDY7230460.1 hypothetical protein [Hyalangium sp. s54d21]
MILIVTSRGDAHALAAERAFEKKGVAFRTWYIDDHPPTLEMAFRPGGARPRGTLGRGGETIALDDIRAVWHRKPKPMQYPAGLDPQLVLESQQETGEGLRALFLHLEDRFWVNPPWHERELALSKVHQLEVASALGFRVPRTLLTNDPQELQAFYRSCGGEVIYKLVSGVAIPGVLQNGRVLYTTKLTPRHLAEVERLVAAPGLFQEYIPKRSELRVNVIGRKVFATLVDSQQVEESRVDWRRGQDRGLEFRAHELPPAIEERCRAFTRSLGLAFGALDLILTPDGDYVLLEINPAGQWLWIERETRQPLLDNLTEMLLQGTTDYVDSMPERRVTPDDTLRYLSELER